MRLNNKQLIVLVVGGIGLYFYSNKKEKKCPQGEKLFSVEGQMLCESELSAKGYFFYAPSVAGRSAGYYSFKSWDSGFNLPDEAKLKWVEGAVKNVMNEVPGNQLWTISQKTLDDYFIDGSQPLSGAFV